MTKADAEWEDDLEAFVVNFHYAVAHLDAHGQPEANAPHQAPHVSVSFSDLRMMYGSYLRCVMRMSEPCFSKLVEILRDHLPSRGMSTECRVFAALRCYAGASYLDLCAVLKISSSSFFDAVWDFADAVLRALALQMQMPL